jgi:hypothetical protein
VQYFKCRPSHGALVRARNVQLLPNVEFVPAFVRALCEAGRAEAALELEIGVACATLHRHCEAVGQTVEQLDDAIIDQIEVVEAFLVRLARERAHQLEVVARKRAHHVATEVQVGRVLAAVRSRVARFISSELGPHLAGKLAASQAQAFSRAVERASGRVIRKVRRKVRLVTHFANPKMPFSPR